MRNPLHSVLLTLLRWTATLLLGSLVAVNAFCADGDTPEIIIGFATKSFHDVELRDAEAAMHLWTREIATSEVIEAKSRVYTDVKQLLADYRRGKVDMVISPPLDFLRVESVLRHIPAYTSTINGKITQRYVILTSADKSHSNIAALKGSRIVHTSNDDMGLLFLNTLLLRNRLPEMDRHFSSIQTKGKSSQAIHALYFGAADVCVTTERAFKRITELNPQIGKKINVVAVSPELIRDIVFYSTEMDVSLRQKLDARSVSIKNTARGKQILTLFQIDDYVVTQDADIAPSRQLYHEYKRLKGKLQWAR